MEGMNTTPFWKRSWVIVLGVLVVIAVLVIGTLVSMYNGFVTKEAAVDTQWAQVENQFQRRFDLIPNLVRAAESVQDQEQDVFLGIADARSKYAGATTPEQKAEAANEVEGSLARLLVVIESYPQLASAQNVLSVQDELAGTENRLSAERGRFNERVQEYNLAVRRFPASIVAAVFGFQPRALFEAAAGADQAPEAFTPRN